MNYWTKWFEQKHRRTLRKWTQGLTDEITRCVREFGTSSDYDIKLKFFIEVSKKK